MGRTGRMVSMALAVVVTGAVQAGTDWWSQGRDMLRLFGGPGAAQGLSQTDIAEGLREALRVGTGNVVTRLGREDGFRADPAVHIPLPPGLARIRDKLERVGMSAMLDDLELRMNRAAEVATPRAKALFLNAIGQMTLEDAQGIYKGPDDAATRYFQSRMSQPLAAEMRPIVDESLAEVGAVQSYDRLMGRYQALPFVPDLKADLTGHVLDRAIAGVFHYLALEEAAIRREPAKRTTELLRKMFGGG